MMNGVEIAVESLGMARYIFQLTSGCTIVPFLLKPSQIDANTCLASFHESCNDI